MLRARGQSHATPIPFGPYLAVAGWVALIWGADITASYLQFAGFAQ
jgi:leader peptidase (prepilin peptidase) / N-methyltransferase